MNIRLFFLCTLFIGWWQFLDAQEKSLDARLGELLQNNVYINGHNIVLPCKLVDLQRVGWKAAKDSLTAELAPYQPTDKRGIRLVNKDNQYLEVRFYNPHSQAIPIKDCFIFTFSTYDGFQYGIDPEDYHHAPDFEVCGLKSKKATPQYIMKTCGEFLAKRQFEAVQLNTFVLRYPFFEEGTEEEPNNSLYLEISKRKDYYPGKLIVMSYMCLGDLLQKEKYLVPYRME